MKRSRSVLARLRALLLGTIKASSDVSPFIYDNNDGASDNRCLCYGWLPAPSMGMRSMYRDIPMLRIPLLDALLVLIATEQLSSSSSSSSSLSSLSSSSVLGSNMRRYLKWIVVCKLTQLLIAVLDDKETDTDTDLNDDNADGGNIIIDGEGDGNAAESSMDQLRRVLESTYPSISGLLCMIINAVAERDSVGDDVGGSGKRKSLDQMMMMMQGLIIRSSFLNSILMRWLEFIRTAVHLLFRSFKHPPPHHPPLLLHPPHLWLQPSDVYSTAAIKAEDSSSSSNDIIDEASTVILLRDDVISDSQLRKHLVLAGLSDLLTTTSQPAMSSCTSTSSSSSSYDDGILCSVHAWLDDLSQLKQQQQQLSGQPQHIDISSIDSSSMVFDEQIDTTTPGAIMMTSTSTIGMRIRPSDDDNYDVPRVDANEEEGSIDVIRSDALMTISHLQRQHVHARLHVLQASLPPPQLIPLPSEYTKLHGMITATIKRGLLHVIDGDGGGLSSSGGLGTSTSHLICRRPHCFTTESVTIRTTGSRNGSTASLTSLVAPPPIDAPVTAPKKGDYDFMRV